MAEETWKILISEDAVGGGGGGIGGEGGGDTADLPTAQKTFYQTMQEYWKAWKPFIAVGGLLYGMYKFSQLSHDMLKTTFSLLSAMMDLVFLPLIPLFIKIFEAVAPLVSKIGILADAFLTPIVNFLMPILESILEWVTGINFDKAAKWLGEKSESIVAIMTSIQNWLISAAWPKVTEWTKELQAIWAGESAFWEKLKASANVFWTDIKPYASAAWAEVVNLWNTKVWPIIELVWDLTKLYAFKTWINIKDDFNVYVITPLKSAWEVITKHVGDSWSYLIGDYLPKAWGHLIGTVLPAFFRELPSKIIGGTARGAWDVITPWDTSRERGLNERGAGGFPSFNMPQWQSFGGGGNNIINQIDAIFNIEIPTSGDVDTLVRELEEKLADMLNNFQRQETGTR